MTHADPNTNQMTKSSTLILKLVTRQIKKKSEEVSHIAFTIS